MLSIALALSIDSFAVSAAGGCGAAEMRSRDKLLAASVFALAQTLFAAAGWLAGAKAVSAVEGYVEAAAFALLFAVGAKMCFDSLKKTPSQTANFISPPNMRLLCALAAATSVDALAVGVSLAFVNAEMPLPCAAIAAVTFCASLAGIEIGKAAAKISRRLPALGGIILITIAFLILLSGD